MSEYLPDNILLSFPKGEPGPAGPAGPRGPVGPAGSTFQAIPPRYTTAERPAADVALAGIFIRLKDLNQPERLQICLENVNGVFEWVTLAISSL